MRSFYFEEGPSGRKSWRKGISPRRFDHVNLATNMEPTIVIDFLTEKLGFKIREYLKDPDNKVKSAWLSVTTLVHDVAIMQTKSAQTSAELHHLSYWSDNAQDILRAADILRENEVEFVGPGKHGISQAMYIYVIDPGSGARLELFSNGYQIFEPDWEPIEWNFSEMKVGFTYWGEQAGMSGEIETLTPAGQKRQSITQ